MGEKLLYWGGGLLLLLLCVRAVAPAIQEWGWKQQMYADREASARALEQDTETVSVETIVSRPIGMMLAASVCGDPALEGRALKALVAFARKLQPNRSEEDIASAQTRRVQAHADDPRLVPVLKADCHRTLELASAAVDQYEK